MSTTYLTPSASWNNPPHSNGFTTWNTVPWQEVPNVMYATDTDAYPNTPPPPYVDYASYATTTNALGLSFGNNGHNMMESNNFDSFGHADVYRLPSQADIHLQLEDPGFYPQFAPVVQHPSIPSSLFVPLAEVGYDELDSNTPAMAVAHIGHGWQEAIDQEATELLKAPQMKYRELPVVDDGFQFEVTEPAKASDRPDDLMVTFPIDEDFEDEQSVEAALLVAELETLSLEETPISAADDMEYRWE